MIEARREEDVRLRGEALERNLRHEVGEIREECTADPWLWARALKENGVLVLPVSAVLLIAFVAFVIGLFAGSV